MAYRKERFRNTGEKNFLIHYSFPPQKNQPILNLPQFNQVSIFLASLSFFELFVFIGRRKVYFCAILCTHGGFLGQ